MSTNNDSSFAGFEQPRANYYRLPNDWFDLWAWVRERLNTSRLDGPIKWLEFLIKHSWGYLNFDVPVKLTIDEFADGRRCATDDGSRGERMDLGTGLSSRTLVNAPQRLLNLGLIERRVDDEDAARVKHYYLPRLRPTDETVAPLASQTLETFQGFDSPHSNYFPVPFEWTNLCRDITSGVAILAGEYLMRHTFGWRDPVRWLTPTEIASGRQRIDGTTYDDGIQYPRHTVAVACESLVAMGILVWRPTERDIGREKRQYALRMQGMVLDESSGLWLGWALDEEMETAADSEASEIGQSKALIPHYKGGFGQESKGLTSQSKALTGQSKALTDQSKALTEQSKGLTGQSKALTEQSKGLTEQSTPRSDNNTSLQHPCKHKKTTPTATPIITTPTTTPIPPSHNAGADEPPNEHIVVAAVAAVSVVDDDALEQALSHVGITGKKRREILSLDDPPHPVEVYGWVYWAHAQDWTVHNPIGAAINRLLDPDTRHDPPTPFLDFGRAHGGQSHTARALHTAYRLAGYSTPWSSNPASEAWDAHFGRQYPDELPLSHPEAEQLWERERRVLATGLDRPPDDDAHRRWSAAWQAFLASPSHEGLEADTEHRPLGYAGDALVVLIRPIEQRVAMEAHRADLEAVVGLPLQFTSVEIEVMSDEETAEVQAQEVAQQAAQQAAQMWSRVAQELQLSTAPATFQQHFGPCRPVALEGHTLSVHSPNDQSLAWITQRLQPVIVSATSRASKEVKHLHFITDGGSQLDIAIPVR